MIYNDDKKACIEVLQQGGLILYPTDTVWGIGCDATNEAAVERIYRLKKRHEEKSMIILVAEETDIKRYTNDPNPVIFDYIKGIHKPTTVIYQQAKHLAKNLVNRDGSVAIRLVREPFCRELILDFGKPIVSTSSNISGYPTPAFFEDIDLEIKKGVDYVVRYRQEERIAVSPSTIVKLGSDGNIQVIRP